MSTYRALAYEKAGDPAEVLRLVDLPEDPVTTDTVRLKFLAAPINPSDVNTIEGKYPLKPALNVPGGEGVAEVVEVGPQVSSLKVGDWVVPVVPQQSTWRQQAVLKAQDWRAVPRDLPLGDLATLTINPPSALGMLEQFVELQPGDCVVQNGANSQVGQAVIQLARAKGLHTVNIIRDRPNWAETVEELRALGADVVTTEEQARADLEASGLPAPRLGLNCVGGSAALAVAKLLGEGGTVVTYGAMSLQPFTIPAGLFIFKDLTFRGFWLSGREKRAQSAEQRAALVDRLVEHVRAGHLGPVRCDTFPLSQYQDALVRARAPLKSTKVLLLPSE